MGALPDPTHLSTAISELIAVRGLARVRGDEQLKSAWKEVAGPAIAGKTRVLNLRRGVLQIGVAHAALLSELVSFHKAALLRTLKQQHTDLKIRDLKFRLKGEAE